jgi:hypothetical protein
MVFSETLPARAAVLGIATIWLSALASCRSYCYDKGHIPTNTLGLLSEEETLTEKTQVIDDASVNAAGSSATTSTS